MKLTEAEWKVMNALWQSASTTARDVHDRVKGETDWAYTTVKTILDRLGEKGAVAVGARGNTNLYEPLVTKRDARRAELRSTMDRAFDGAFGALMHFLVSEEKLSKKDRKELRRILNEHDRKRGGR